MQIQSPLKRWLSGTVGFALSAAVTLVAIVVVVRSVDGDLVGRAIDQARQSPGSVLLAVVAFALAFVMRAVAWRLVLPGLAFGQGLSAIHVALGANHVLPLRLGEPLRVISVVRRTKIDAGVATASTVTLRAADVLSMAAIGLAVAPSLFVDLVGPFGWILLIVVIAVAVYGWRWISRVARSRPDVRLPGPATFALAGLAWCAESVVIWQAARWVGLDLGWRDALLITTVAVAAQIAAIAPGGFGTYEAAAVAAFVALGYEAEPALVAALGAHAVKTAYSLVGGLVAVFLPSPGFLGRFRLRTQAGGGEDGGGEDGVGEGGGGEGLGPPRVDPDAPVVLFMPAYNEEASVAACVRRAPAEVLGHPVEVVVVDDGSSDATAERAAAVGADVLSMGCNQGLGAAVRRGLLEGGDRGAVVVAFCDADGEYPPEELARLVAPILDGEADYVTGSRFLGRIEHMRPHRRFGNIVLTMLLSVVARKRITDGQTGYRAFSAQAAAQAEIIHDFNYAQVLTLDLLAKGFRLSEVPISYHFRTQGESFIKLGPYLRSVVPAVYRELNAG